MDLVRADVSLYRSGTTAHVSLRCTGEAEEKEVVPTPDTIEEIWNNMKMDTTWAPDQVKVEGNVMVLSEALAKGNLRVVSDGSYKRKLGTAAATLTTQELHDSITIVAQVTGLKDDQSAYRSELMGLLCGLVGIQWLEDVYKTRGKVTVVCDGLSALNHALEDHLLHPKQPQFDLLSAIRGLRQKISSTIIPSHVKGHQDRYSSWYQLDWWARRNCWMDFHAKAFRRQLERQGKTVAPNPWFAWEPWALYVDGVKQSRLVTKMIAERLARSDIIHYWERKGRFPSGVSDLIDWDSVEKGMKESPPGLQRWVSKHCVGMSSVGKFKKIWGMTDDPSCPLCGLFEDARHVGKCPSPTARQEWNFRIGEFRGWLDDQETHPDISATLVQLLNTWSTGQIFPFRVPISVIQAARAQRRIGMTALAEGLLATHWAKLQHQHYVQIRSRRTGNRWAALVTKQIWLLVFHLWEHRNNRLHSDTCLDVDEESRKFDEAILREYKRGSEDLPIEAQFLFGQPVDQRLTASLADRQRWMALVQEEWRIVANRQKNRREQQRRFRRAFSNDRGGNFHKAMDKGGTDTDNHSQNASTNIQEVMHHTMTQTQNSGRNSMALETPQSPTYNRRFTTFSAITTGDEIDKPEQSPMLVETSDRTIRDVRIRDKDETALNNQGQRLLPFTGQSATTQSPPDAAVDEATGEKMEEVTKVNGGWGQGGDRVENLGVTIRFSAVDTELPFEQPILPVGRKDISEMQSSELEVPNVMGSQESSDSSDQGTKKSYAAIASPNPLERLCPSPSALETAPPLAFLPKNQPGSGMVFNGAIATTNTSGEGSIEPRRATIDLGTSTSATRHQGLKRNLSFLAISKLLPAPYSPSFGGKRVRYAATDDKCNSNNRADPRESANYALNLATSAISTMNETTTSREPAPKSPLNNNTGGGTDQHRGERGSTDTKSGLATEMTKKRRRFSEREAP